MKRRWISRALVGVVLTIATGSCPALAADGECGAFVCPEIDYQPGTLTAAYVAQELGGLWVASNIAPTEQPYTFRLQSPCEIDSAAGGVCRPDDDALCPAPPDRVVQTMVIE